MIEIFCRLLLVFLLAFMIGKIASALKMPSVLGFFNCWYDIWSSCYKYSQSRYFRCTFISKHHITFRVLHGNDAGKWNDMAKNENLCQQNFYYYCIPVFNDILCCFRCFCIGFLYCWYTCIFKYNFWRYRPSYSPSPSFFYYQRI